MLQIYGDTFLTNVPIKADTRSYSHLFQVSIHNTFKYQHTEDRLITICSIQSQGKKINKTNCNIGKTITQTYAIDKIIA